MTSNEQHLHTLFKITGSATDWTKANWYAGQHMKRFDRRRAHRLERLRIAGSKAERWKNRYQR